jgi:hypothetical protein
MQSPTSSIVVIGNTLEEHIGNLMGTHWELEGNKGKMKKISPPPPHQHEREKIKALSVHAEPSHWQHEISMFQNCSSPFLAWANTLIINRG